MLDTLALRVCCVPENGEDVIYVVTGRNMTGLSGLGGGGRQYIERMTSRQVDSIEGVFMDSSLTYDGRNTSADTLRVDNGITWVAGETMKVFASAPTFLPGDVGNEFWVNSNSLANADKVKMSVVSYVSSTEVNAKPDRTVPVSLRGTARATWSRAVDEVGGLWHIEGKAVSILGSGFVLASPANSSYVVKHVSGGKITLDGCFDLIHVGLGYTPYIVTLDVDVPYQDGSIAEQGKLINRVTVLVQDTRSLWAIENDQRPVEYKIRQFEGYDDPITPYTGKAELDCFGNWDRNGRIGVGTMDPLPITILGVIPAGNIPRR
jgi:hypothetical protein